MGTKDKERRVYPKEFKAEAVALAEKHEKPVRQVAVDLGINENMLHRWIQQAREAGGTGMPPFPGHGRPRDEELTRLRKEVKALREANEILKKAAAIFAQEGSR
ncbi:MAG: transposase [Spirochaetaceae bacterium]|jgi:transposase|nr:transposase [Spirochaetaceae bacterium]